MKLTKGKVECFTKAEFSRGYIEGWHNKSFLTLHLNAGQPYLDGYEFYDWTAMDLRDLSEAINAFLREIKNTSKAD